MTSLKKELLYSEKVNILSPIDILLLEIMEQIINKLHLKFKNTELK